MELDNFNLSLSNILEKVDEYSLYCHYLGFDPDIRGTYSSPIREDDERPSFSFFDASNPRDVEFLWKDSALNVGGTIVDLVRYMYDISYTDAMIKIDQDFNLGLTNSTKELPNKPVVRKRPPKKGPANILVSSKSEFTQAGKEFWASFGITIPTLNKYQVTQLDSAVINGRPIAYYSRLAFAYRIADKYKIYLPHDKDFKFINNYDERFVEGFHQLPQTSDYLVITKSLKDVMCLYEMGVRAISPRSESTMIPQPYFKWIDERYENVYVLFDNDMKHNGDMYPYPKIYVPKESGEKDISDYVRKYGKRKGIWLMRRLLNLEM